MRRHVGTRDYTVVLPAGRCDADHESRWVSKPGISGRRHASYASRNRRDANSTSATPSNPYAQTGNGATAVRAHDQDGNVTTINTTGLSLIYTYDYAMRIASMADQNNSALGWSFDYGGQNRLTDAANGTTTEGWYYDLNGNPVSQEGPSTNGTWTGFAYSGSNRIVSPDIVYDNAGNMGLYYDAMGSSYIAAGEVVTNTLRQRVADQVGARTLWDNEGHIVGEYEWGGVFTDQPNAIVPVEETVYLRDLPVAAMRGQLLTDSSGDYAGFSHPIYYVHADHLNTPRLLTVPSSNALAWRWDSDSFGYGEPNHAPTPGVQAMVYNLRFPGQIAKYGGSLYYNWFRDYDSTTGRYIQSDPIGLAGGINTYAYVKGNPISSARAGNR